MTSTTPTRPLTGPLLLRRLREAGATVLAYDGRLRLAARRGSLDAELVSLAGANKPAVLAALTGRAVPTNVPGVVWHPRGGVALAEAVVDPEYTVRLACWRCGRRLGFPLVGRERWASFAATAPLDQVLDLLSIADDLPHASRPGAYNDGGCSDWPDEAAGGP